MWIEPESPRELTALEIAIWFGYGFVAGLLVGLLLMVPEPLWRLL